MSLRRLVLVGGAVLGLGFALAGPAAASQGGMYLKTGDRVCTDQAYSETGVRISAWVLSGRGTVSVSAASTAGGAETVIWSVTESTGVDQHVYHSSPGTYFRLCVTITTHAVNTWTKQFLYGFGASAAADIGPNWASLSPGASACGDRYLGPVQLTGTATGPATWYITALDEDYGSVGTVFSIQGSSVDTVFTPPPNLTLLEMCVQNTSQARIDASWELSGA
jgi:hypothetical protein